MSKLKFILIVSDKTAFDWLHSAGSFHTAAEKNSRQYKTATMDKEMSHFQSRTHTTVSARQQRIRLISSQNDEILIAVIQTGAGLNC